MSTTRDVSEAPATLVWQLFTHSCAAVQTSFASETACAISTGYGTVADHAAMSPDSKPLADTMPIMLMCM